MTLRHILISTHVAQDYTTVFNQFDEKLFAALQPPFPPAEVVRFDGSEVGDEVHVKLFTGFKKELWISRITERTLGEEEHVFTDKGIQLPSFLTYWKHRHRVRKEPAGCTIIDDITLSFASPLLYPIFYPEVYMQFAMRKPIYRKYFSEGSK
ncbi:hypothetical protein BH09BAC1_BH09BAC1_15720 [soil metagenome]